MDVFHTDEDRARYLALLSEQGTRFGLRFLSYCLMTNHVHLIAIPARTESLARAVGEAHRLYTRSVNQREAVSGYLFQGRFHSCPLDERHLVATVRYIERNPVRAGLVRVPWRYAWSSAAFHVGLRRDDPLVLDRDFAGLVTDWPRLLRADPDEVDFLREKIRTGRPCGTDKFVRRAGRLTRRNLQLRPRGRPRQSRK